MDKSGGIWPKPTIDPPDLDTMIEVANELGSCMATDGCVIETDGTCEHGHPSWLVRLGLI